MSLLSRRRALTQRGPVMGVNGTWYMGANPNVTFDRSSAVSLGAGLMRNAFDLLEAGANVASAASDFGDQGVTLLPIAGLTDWSGMPTPSATTTAINSWKTALEPEGVRYIEFGNEDCYEYMSGTGQAYIDAATAYGLAAKAAADALVGSSMSLLIQLEDGGTGTSTWITNVSAASGLLNHAKIGGATIHPYGTPYGADKAGRLLTQLASAGWNSSLPVWITEWGIATDNGATLTDNAGYPVDLTYAQTETLFEQEVAYYQGVLGSRLAGLLFYRATDLSAPGATTNNQHYYGMLRLDQTDKTGFTPTVRTLLAG